MNEETPAAGSAAPIRVLIVEDAADDAALIVRAMSDGGLEFDHELVSTVAEAGRRIRDGSWDAIVCDYRLSGGTALDILTVASRDAPGTPFVVVSGSVGEEPAIAAMRAGAADYVLKDHLVRLGPSLRRAMRESALRRERETARQALVRSLERARELETIIDRSPAVVFRWRPEPGWPIDYVTDNVRQFGFEAAVLLARNEPFEAMVHPDDRPRLRDEVRRYLDEGRREFSQSYRIVCAEGETRWIDDRTWVDRAADGRIVSLQGVLVDVTERHQLQEQLHHAQKMEAIGRLAGGVAHDFNNLLTVMTGYADLLAIELPDNETLSGYVDEIRHTVWRASTLTKQLLAFSRKQIRQPRLIDLNRVVLDSTTMLRRLIGEDIELKVDLAERCGRVLADPGQVDQVIVNLAVNARDAMPGGGRLSISTRVESLPVEGAALAPDLPAGRYVRLGVADTGHGIDEATMKRIFEPFFTTKAHRGTGLGLSTAYGIVKQSGGDIAATSATGGGTTFSIWLPQTEEGPEKATVERPTPRPGGTERILLVEDEDAVRRVVSVWLRGQGYQVVEATNMADALDRIDSEPPFALLLTDVVMPGGTGPALARTLAERGTRIRTLFMTGYTDDDSALRRGLDQGADVLAKPFGVNELARMVREVLDRDS